MIDTEAAWRSPLCLMLLAHAPIWFEVSASCPCNVSVRRRAASARSRACARVAAVVVATASVCCEALAASSAPVAICSIARRSSSAADAASVIPLASSSVAAAIRSSIFCWRPATPAGAAGLRCRPLARSAAGDGTARTRLCAIPLVARADVFIRDLPPRLATCIAASEVPASAPVPLSARARGRSRSTSERAPFAPPPSTPYDFLRIDRACPKSRAKAHPICEMIAGSKLRAIRQLAQAAKK